MNIKKLGILLLFSLLAVIFLAFSQVPVANAAGGSRSQTGAYAQPVWTTVAGASTGSTAALPNVIQNDYVIVVVGFSGTGQTVKAGGVTDTRATSFSKTASSDLNQDTEMWCGQETAATGADTVTVQSTANANYVFTVYFMGGLSSCTALTSQTNHGASGAMSVGSFTPATGDACVGVGSEFTGAGGVSFTQADPFLDANGGGATAPATSSNFNTNHYAAAIIRGAWNSNDGATTATITPSTTSSPTWDEVVACYPTSSAGNEVYNSGLRGGGRTATQTPGEGVNAVLKGDYIVQLTIVVGTAQQITSVTDNNGAGDTFTKVVQSNVHNDVEIWIAQALQTNDGGFSVTSNLNGVAANSAVMGWDIGSISSTTAQTFTNSGTAATVTVASSTPNSYDLCIEVAGISTGTAGATFTNPANQPLQNLAGSGNIGTSNSYLETTTRANWPSGVSTTGTITPSSTSSPTWDVVVACFPGTVIVPLTCTMDNSGAQAIVSLSESSGNALSPTTAACDGSSHNITVDPSVTLTATEPADGANTRDRFSGGGTTIAVGACASAATGKCSAWSFTNYEQLQNTYQATPNAQATWDGGLTSAAVVGTVAGTASTTGCSIILTGGGGAASCSAWFDYNRAVAIGTSTLGGAPANTQWLRSGTCSFSQTTGGNTNNCNYYKQLQNTYQASPFVPSTWDASGISLDGSNALVCTNVLSCSTSLTTADTNDLVMGFCAGNVGQTGFTISDTSSLTWHQRASVLTGPGNDVIEVFYATSSSKLTSDSITCTNVPSGTHNTVVSVFGVNGANTGTPFDPNVGLPNTNSAASSSSPSCTTTTTNANDLLFTYMAHGGNSITGTPAGFSNIRTTAGSPSSYTGFDIVSSTQSGVSESWTLNSATYWATWCDAIQAAVGGVTVTGTLLGSTGQVVCTTASPTSGSSAAISCTAYSDYNATVTVGVLTVGSNERWAPATATYTDTTGGNTHADNYYEQLQNTYQVTPNAQATWDAGLTAQNAVGTVLGAGSSTICTIALTSGGGAQTCTGWADNNLAVVIGAATIAGAPANSQWLRNGACSFTQTTGGNTDNCNYYKQWTETWQATANAESTFDSGLSTTVSGTVLGVSSITICALSPTSGMTIGTCSGYIDNSQAATFSTTMSGAGSNTQWKCGTCTTASQTSGGNTVNVNYYKQLQNTYQATPNAQVTWDAGLTAQNAVGTWLGSEGQTVCTITLTGGSGAQSCTAYGDYNAAVVIGAVTIGGAPVNSQWLRSGACSFRQTTGGNTDNCNFYKQFTNNFAYSVTDGGSPTAPTLTCTQLGSSVGCGTLSTSSTAIWVDSGGSYSATNPTTGSTGTERWDSNSASGTISSGGSTVTIAYYHQYLQTLSYAVTGGGSPAPPTATGSQFGSAYAPTLTGSATGYWFDATGSISFTNPISGAANERWDSSVSSISATSSATTALNYYHQYQNTYQAVPRARGTFDGVYVVTLTGTFLGTSLSTICTITTANGGGTASCAGYADYNTLVSMGVISGAPSNTRWQQSGTISWTDTTGGNAHAVNFYDQTTNTYTLSPAAPTTWDNSFSPTVTGTLLGVSSSTVCTASLASAGGAASCSGYTDYNSAANFPAIIADGSNQQWTASGTTAFTDTTGGNTHTVSYYLDYTGISFTSTPSAPATWDGAFSITVSGTYLGAPATICTITTSNGGGSASCSGTVDDGTSITFANAIADGSNVRWETGQATQTPSGGGTSVTANYYNQLRNTYQATPSSPTTWDGVFTVTITGTYLGAAGQTVCSVNTSNGGGSVSCSGYSDYNTQVSFPLSLNSGEWVEQGSYQFTDTTGGNTHTVNFASTVTQSITLTVAEAGAPTATFTLSGCSVSPTTIVGDGSPHSFTAFLSCTITITVPSDGANTRDRFSGGTTTTLVTCASGNCSGFSTTYYSQLQNTFQTTPNAQATWDAGLTAQNAVGTVLGTGSSTLCSITLTSGGGVQSCSGWADYNLPVAIGSSTITGAPANSQWLRSGACSFRQTTGGNTDNCNFYKQFTNNFAYSVTDGGSPTAPTLTCTQLGSSVPCGMLGLSSTAIWIDSGGSYSATNPTTGSTGSERWDSTAASGAIGSGGSAITIAYYHQYLQTLSYSVSGGGSPAPPVASGSQFGSAYSPSLTGSATGYWFDATGSVSFTNPIAGSANERWISAVPSITAISSGTVALTYYHQYQNTYRFSPSVPSTWDSAFSPMITGTQAGSSGSNICTASLASGGGAASCSGYADSGTVAAFPSSIADGSGKQWTASGAISFTDSSGGNIHTVSYYEQFAGLTFTAVPSVPSVWDSALSISVTGTYLGGSTTVCTISTSAGGGAASCSGLIDAGTSITFANAVSDGANARWETGQASQIPTGGSITTANYYLQLQDAYQAIPNAQLTWDGGLTAPTVTGTVLGVGSTGVCALTLTSGGGAASCSGWADYNLPVSVGTIGGAPANSRWQARGTTSFTDNGAGGHSYGVNYYKQYTLTVTGGNGIGYSVPSQTGDNYWDSGTSLTVSSNGVFNRAAGVGQRVSSWNVDGGANVAVASVGTVTTSSLTMSAPHAVNFLVVTQYEVSLDPTSTSALSSCTPPSVSGDNYWYDGGTPTVTCSLNGAWGRAGGTGNRLTSYSLNGAPSTPLSTTGTVTALSVSSIASPQSISSTAVVQHQLLLTASPPAAGIVYYETVPSVSGDTGWYDSGTPVSFSVVPNTGFNFFRWVGTGVCSYSGIQKAPSLTMTCAASETASFDTYVLQPIVLRASSAVDQTPAFVITGCDPSPSVISGDGAPHSIRLDPYCSFTISIVNTGGTRYGFSISGVFSSESNVNPSCTFGVCSAIEFTYFEQMDEQFSYSVSDPSPGFSAPSLTCTQLGSSGPCGTLTQSQGSYWLDYGSSWGATNPLTGSNGAERWLSASASGLTSAPSSITIVYSHQFLISFTADPQAAGTTDPVSGTSQWLESGSNLNLDASPANGYDFSSWTTSNPNGITFSMAKAASTTALIGGAGAITARFSLGLFPVTFFESGLPAGVVWTITVDGQVATSNTTSLTFDLLPGSHSWAVSTPLSGQTSGVRFVAPTAGDTFTVNGPSMRSIGFVTQYFLTVSVGSSASGITLSPASGWYDAGSKLLLNASAGSAMHLAFVSWTGTGPGSYTGPEPTAMVIIAGPVTETASFTPEMGAITFLESGLPSGVRWSVVLNGVNETTLGGSITFSGLAVGSTVNWVIQSSISPPETGSVLIVVSSGVISVTITFTTSPTTVTSTLISTLTSTATSVTVTTTTTTTTSTSSPGRAPGRTGLDYALAMIAVILLAVLVSVLVSGRLRHRNH